MFELNKKWNFFIVKQLKIIVISFYGFYSFAHLNLQPICKGWCIAHKLDHFILFFPFIVAFFDFMFPSYKAFMATSHSSPLHLIQLIMHIERKL
jgi:hypothetical protein